MNGLTQREADDRESVPVSKHFPPDKFLELTPGIGDRETRDIQIFNRLSILVLIAIYSRLDHIPRCKLALEVSDRLRPVLALATVREYLLAESD